MKLQLQLQNKYAPGVKYSQFQIVCHGKFFKIYDLRFRFWQKPTGITTLPHKIPVDCLEISVCIELLPFHVPYSHQPNHTVKMKPINQSETKTNEGDVSVDGPSSFNIHLLTLNQQINIERRISETQQEKETNKSYDSKIGWKELAPSMPIRKL